MGQQELQGEIWGGLKGGPLGVCGGDLGSHWDVWGELGSRWGLWGGFGMPLGCVGILGCHGDLRAVIGVQAGR